MAVLAAQGRLRVAVLGYAAALAILLLSQASAGASLMAWLVGLWAAIAVLLLLALRPAIRAWLPWGALAAAGGADLSLQLLVWAFGLPASLALQWLLAVAAAAGVFGLAWWASTDLRSALAR
jgi:hypothetical protein